MWPFDIYKFALKPNDKSYEEALKYEVIGVVQLDTTVAAIKGAISKGYPVVLGIRIYRSFESDQVTKHGLISRPDMKREESLGGHTVCLVGYDDSMGSFILRSSWGMNWGFAGHAYLPYGYVEDGCLVSNPWIITAVETPLKATAAKAIPTRP
jgi:C1A family cysteine protease